VAEEIRAGGGGERREEKGVEKGKGQREIWGA
jgi:hypothetical protein